MLNPDYILFQFGTNDIHNTLPKYKNEEEVVKKYILAAKQLCKNYGLLPIFITPIIIEAMLSTEPSKKFHYFLEKECIENNLTNPINIFNVISKNFKQEQYDRYTHLNRSDSIKTLDYIISKLN
jgi:hypothetical protein